MDTNSHNPEKLQLASVVPNGKRSYSRLVKPGVVAGLITDAPDVTSRREFRVKALKLQAKKISRLTGESHMKILHQLALNNGYRSWSHLLEDL